MLKLMHMLPPDDANAVVPMPLIIIRLITATLCRLSGLVSRAPEFLSWKEAHVTSDLMQTGPQLFRKLVLDMVSALPARASMYMSVFAT